MRQPDIISKSLAVSCITILVIFLSITAYLVSALKNKLDSYNFTISQAIAFGNKPSMIILIILAFSILSYLSYYRGHKYLYIRLFLNLIISSLMITIIWITTYYSEDDHYILAGIIFTAVLISIILNTYLVYNGLLVKTKTKNIILLSIPILSIICYIGLIVGNIDAVSNKVVQLFPAFELAFGVVFTTSISTLGFL